MEYLLANSADTQQIYELVQETIKTIYPKYYPKEVVDFFCQHHNFNAIKEDVDKGTIGVVRQDQQIIGTGCYQDNHITRVYVKPTMQGQGIGSFIMQKLEEIIATNYDQVFLDASLPARGVYEHRGYHTVKHDCRVLEDDVRLVYEVMGKSLTQEQTGPYHGKRFVLKQSTGSGEVDQQTIFSYQQTNDMIWATYAGGDILKGFLLGSVASDGTLNFHYQHLNRQQMVRIGMCHSTPIIQADGSIELHEEWTWLNQDGSSGTSILVEVKE